MPTLRKRRQEDSHKVQAGLGYLVRSRLDCLKKKSNHFNMLQQDILLLVRRIVDSM